MYDTAKIGKKIGSGFDRSVYQYGDDRVIKISYLGTLAPKKLNAKMRHDYDVCKRYFGDYVLDTENVSDPHRRECVEIQSYIPGEPVSKKHMANPQMRAQLEDIVKKTEMLVSDGYAPIDLIGGGGVFLPRLSNVLVDRNGKLQIIDATLHEATSVRPIGYFIDIFFPFVIRLQQYRLGRMLAV